jgi:hypothetical protein
MNLLTIEDEKFKNVTVLGYEFKIRFIAPLDRVRITQRRMNLQDGKSIESLTQDEFNFFENIAMIDVCVEELPKEFPKNESCIKWIDINLINGLAQEIRNHTSELETELKKNKVVG